jgi:hypothetical protein
MTSVSGISSSATTPANPVLTRANKALKMLLTSTDVVQALASQSSVYVPPTSKQIMSVLWAMFDVKSISYITKDDVAKAVTAEGGKPSDATALWSQMDPKNKGFINAGDFITNSYLLDQVPPITPKLLESVKNVQQIFTGKSGSILDAFSNPNADVLSQSFNADVLSQSFNGSSPIGGPGSDYRKINIFL